MKNSNVHPRSRKRRLQQALALLFGGVILAAMAIAIEAAAPSAPRASAAGPHTDPHGTSGSGIADNCAICHRTHDGRTSELLRTASPQSSLCLTCHDGTGASSNVAAEFTGVPANNATTGTYYSHPATTASNHTSAQVSEFAGVLNRHAECSDCHNPHRTSSSAPTQTASGWTASGALTGATGVSKGPTPAWLNPISYEYELCLKCHSSYTGLLSGMSDKAAELATTNASFHPIEGAGKNTSTQINASLGGGKLWNTFTSTSTIRCTNCHGDSRLVTSAPTIGTPTTSARLAPHASLNPGILLAPYQDRVLKTRGTAYNSNDFALCFLCHSDGPFTGSGSTATNFSLHNKHVAGISGEGSGTASTDITVSGAGQGNALCAECHYNTHGSVGNQHMITFAPNVQANGTTGPTWTATASGGTCTLTCHGERHSGYSYGSGGGGTAGAAALAAPSTATAPAAGTGATPTPTRVPPTATPTPTRTPTPTPTPRPAKATPTPVPALN